MPLDDKDVYTSLGALSAKVETLYNNNKEDREFMREKLAILDELHLEFKDAKPILKDINKWKERTIGVVMFVSVISGTLSFFVADIIHYLRIKLGL